MSDANSKTPTPPRPIRVTAPGDDGAADATRTPRLSQENFEQFALEGRTSHFNVYYADDLYGTGVAAADDVLASCEGDYQRVQQYFGHIDLPNLPFNVYLTSRSDGASHRTCDDVALSIGALTSPDFNNVFVRFLIVAEVVEVFEAALGSGWNCGSNHGEGLSRVIPNRMFPGVMPVRFVTADDWLDAPGRPDFVNKTDASDRNPISTGCAVLFLNWLHYRLGFSLPQIIHAGKDTQSLGETYTNLTGRTDGFQRFMATLQSLFPEGTPSGLKSDNPFAASVRHFLEAHGVDPSQGIRQLKSSDPVIKLRTLMDI